MIRLKKEDSWLLLEHAEHARLAGEFARHWKNHLFVPPDPFAHVLDAVSRHDDSWREVDAAPSLTSGGEPAAFSRELVGTYDAFEEIDLEAYLDVRGRATEAAARRDPYAAVLISMHTVNLLTEQADPSGLSPGDQDALEEFVTLQKARQEQLVATLRERDFAEKYLTKEAFRTNFEFLQACDSLSLLVGVDFPEESALRHTHRTRKGDSVRIGYRRVDEGIHCLDPYPLDEDPVTFEFSIRSLPASTTGDPARFREAYSRTEPVVRRVQLQSNRP